MVFTEAESVDRALSAKPILLNGNHRLNVEEKKMRSGDKTSFSDRGDRDLGKRGSQVFILVPFPRVLLWSDFYGAKPVVFLKCCPIFFSLISPVQQWCIKCPSVGI